MLTRYSNLFQLKLSFQRLSEPFDSFLDLMTRCSGKCGAEKHVGLRCRIAGYEPAAAGYQNALVDSGFENAFFDGILAFPGAYVGVLVPVHFDPVLRGLN